MKKFALPLILAATAAPLFAGETIRYTPAASTPVEDSCNWFVGASYGYLTDLDEDMYSAQIGWDTCWAPLGLDTAIYLEVAYANADSHVSANESPFNIPGSVDLDIVPVTLNLKFSGNLIGGLNGYIGGGLGVAFVDYKATASAFPVSIVDEDTSFYAQAFAGLSYNFTEQFEVFGGGRFIYLDNGSNSFQSEVGPELDTDTLLEIGARYHF